ncbi:MAG TPA: hypothetical protein DCM57_00685 [Treponema sp.]|nr:hypothetical protein [Treponema sp.]HBB43324.1 hypothetical protein [Treponema sp.]
MGLTKSDNIGYIRNMKRILLFEWLTLISMTLLSGCIPGQKEKASVKASSMQASYVLPATPLENEPTQTQARRKENAPSPVKVSYKIPSGETKTDKEVEPMKNYTPQPLPPPVQPEEKPEPKEETPPKVETKPSEPVSPPPAQEVPPAEPVPEVKEEDSEYTRSVGTNAGAVTKEAFEEDKKDILEIIEKLDKVMKNRDYKAWLTYLEPASVTYWTKKSNLQKAENRLPVKGLSLRSLEDYFKYVFIPSRSGRRVDEIRYETDSLVKAVQVNGNNDTVYYYFKKSQSGAWKLHLPPISD